jgi:hypothetical protein
VKRQGNARHIVIDGIRRKADVEFLCRAAEEYGREWQLLYVHAHRDLRFQRMNKRRIANGVPPLSYDAFDALDMQECECQLPELERMANITVNNLGDLSPDGLLEKALDRLGALAVQRRIR